MKTKRAFKKTNAQWIGLPSQPIGEGQSARVRTYSIRIRLEYPHPSPKSATIRSIDGEFVWEKLVTCKGRGEAVSQAGQWFQTLRNDGERRGGIGKILIGKKTHELVTVDDNWNECQYGSNFSPNSSMNRLLDKKTIDRVIEESKRNLKIADSPLKDGRTYPSLEWVNPNLKINKNPIKIGFASYSNPPQDGMKKQLEKANIKASQRKPSESLTRTPKEMEEARLIITKMKAENLIKASRIHKHLYEAA